MGRVEVRDPSDGGMGDGKVARAASLLFVGSLYAPELEYRYLGGQKEIFENGARVLEKLGMLKPPRAKDLQINKPGKRSPTEGSLSESLGENGKNRGRRVACLRARNLSGQSSVRSHSVLHQKFARRMGGANDDHPVHVCAVSSQLLQV